MKFLISFLLALLAIPSISAQKTYSVLGDSYSTFLGYVTPAKNLCFYRPTSSVVSDVHQTWWWLYGEDKGMRLLVNNSYSGATICNTGYAKNNYSDRSFVTRMTNIGNPDILFIMGATNDCWANAPLGDFKYAGWTKADLFKFRPAFAYMLAYLKKTHPKMRIVNVCNCGLDGEYNPSMVEICKHYGVECMVLDGIEKQKSHPTVKGMRQVTDQIEFFMSFGMTQKEAFSRFLEQTGEVFDFCSYMNPSLSCVKVLEFIFCKLQPAVQ